jgi:hypothetical protein
MPNTWLSKRRRARSDVLCPFGLIGVHWWLNTFASVAWFVGSATMGLLYGKSVVAVAVFSLIFQLAAIPVIFIANRQR